MAHTKVFDINEVDWKDWGGGLRSCVHKISPDATMQNWELSAGCGGARHNHPAAQLTYVQTGIMKLTIDVGTEDEIRDAEEYILTPGCWALIPSYAYHATENMGSQTVTNIDIFLPDRDDRFESEKIRDFGHTVEKDQ